MEHPARHHGKKQAQSRWLVPSTGPNEQVSLRLMQYPLGEVSRVSLARLGPCRLDLGIDDVTYQLELEGAVKLSTARNDAGGEVTRISGEVVDSGGAEFEIIVNCGNVPPLFGLTLTEKDMAIGSFTFSITHEIQHQILALVQPNLGNEREPAAAHAEAKA